METVVIVIHLMVIVALVALVLMQRSEGGALGIGGAGNFLSTRSQGNVLTRSTAVMATAFFLTSIVLTLIGRFGEKPTSILERVPAAPLSAPAGQAGGAPAGAAGGGNPASGKTMLDQLNALSKGGGQTPAGGGAPAPAGGGTEAPAAPGAPAAPAAGGAAPAAPATPQVPTSQ
jgi:preprotein translocase subunit SecG